MRELKKMESKKNWTNLASVTALLLPLCGMVGAGCSSVEDERGNVDAPAKAVENVGKSTEAIIPDDLIRRTLAPIRALEVPGGVYLRSVDATISVSGTFTQVFYVYQPDANGETIRFEVSAKTSTGTVDFAHSFQAVKVTSRPGQSDQVTQTLPNANGQRTYDVTGSRQGWYRFEFTYGAPNASRTLGFKAYDTVNNPLKIIWSDPPKAPVQVRATIRVDQTSQVFLKGGAYRNADPAQFAYADNVKVNGRLLYRRSFDQGRYAFPLGSFFPGNHTLEFSLAASAYDVAKFWFGVNEKSFAPVGTRTSWDRVQFLYYGEMKTGDYDAWSEGVAFAQGATVTNGVRPPPVRRGTTFSVAVEDASLNGAQSNARVRIISDATGAEVNWTKTLSPQSDYAGGIYANNAFSTKYREHWRVAVPSDAPIGRYLARVTTPANVPIGGDVVFYVIHNPYPSVASGGLSKAELETYGYDEDEDGVELDGPYGNDKDNFRDHFMSQYEFTPPYLVYRQLTGAFRRTQEESKFSLLDHAVAAAQGTTSQFESMRRLYRAVSQRLRYTRQTYESNVSALFLSDGVSPADSLAYAQPGGVAEEVRGGMCYEYAAMLTAIARSLGVVSRQISSDGNIGGWGNHMFMEAYVPNLPQHGGKTTSSNTSPNSDSDPWYSFDATNPDASGSVPYLYLWTRYSEGIGTRSQYGRAAFVLQGYKPNGLVTDRLDWDPLGPTEGVGADDVLSVQAAYEFGPDFWITESGVTGWIGRGEKDVYRISKTTTGASAVSVRALNGATLNPKICIGPYVDPSGPPVEAEPGMLPRWTASIPTRCANPSSTYPLPDGDSYLIVFHHHGQPDDVYPDANDRTKIGDSIQYALDLVF